MEAKLEILNSGFKVISYNGATQVGTGDAYKVENILEASANVFHCSEEGENFDLVLEYGQSDEKFTLTHLVVRGPERCTAPVADG